MGLTLNMKIIISILFLSFFFSGCNNDLKKYYPYERNCYTPNGDEKSFFPGNNIYIDNSKINDFELYMVYNTLDTVTCGYRSEKNKEKKIYIIDTLKFNVTKDGVESLNNKYPVESEYNIFKGGRGKNIITVQNGYDIEVILKQDEKIIESYITDLEYGYESQEYYDFQYIINPLSKSRFQIDTVQYGGFVFEEFKSKIISKNFTKIKGKKIDFFLTKHPDTITYSEIKFGDTYFDECLLGCKKTVLKQIR
tara:strand:+ start:1240 stop:1992 length:753 start_codon:yes stop_codon:yes gene_type:complete